MTQKIEKSIVVDVPVTAAYTQWTRYEEFPEFMEGVQEVHRLDDRRLHWVAEIGNKTKEWDAEIVADHPDELVAWQSTTGADNHGSVRFRSVSPTESEVTLVMEFDPEGAAENLASWFGLVSARIQGDLKRFKEYVESRGDGLTTGQADGETTMPGYGAAGAAGTTGLPATSPATRGGFGEERSGLGEMGGQTGGIGEEQLGGYGSRKRQGGGFREERSGLGGERSGGAGGSIGEQGGGIGDEGERSRVGGPRRRIDDLD